MIEGLGQNPGMFWLKKTYQAPDLRQCNEEAFGLVHGGRKGVQTQAISLGALQANFLD